MAVTRRQFLRTAAAGLGALALDLPFRRLFAARATGATAQGIAPGVRLLLDSRLVAKTANVAPVLGKVTKHPANPLFVPDRPWEENYDNFYGNVVYDDDSGEYKIWYSCVIDGESALLYARSDDGIHWEKPDLGITEFDGSKKNNIVLRGVHGAGVFLDRRETDPRRRYKMIAQHEEGEYLQVAFSDDGVHWSEPVAQERISAAADTHNVALWAPTLGRYVAFTRQWSLWPYNDRSVPPSEDLLPRGYEVLPENHELRRKGVRQVARTQTRRGDDFTTFERAEVVLEGLDIVHQTYAMPVFYYEGIYLGLLAIYEDFLSHRVSTELAWSPDTVRWARICPGEPLIPNGAEGEYDHGMVWGCASPIAGRGEKVLIYYGGFDLPHGDDERRGSLCLATLEKDRWAGYKAGGREGWILTTPIRWQGSSLWVNADAAAGSVRAEVLDPAGRVLDGYAASECRAITSDRARAPVVWARKPDMSEVQGQEIRIRWRVRDAVIYAFGGG